MEASAAYTHLTAKRCIRDSIMPTGEDKDGNLLYLPEVYIDSPNICLLYTSRCV